MAALVSCSEVLSAWTWLLSVGSALGSADWLITVAELFCELAGELLPDWAKDAAEKSKPSNMVEAGKRVVRGINAS